MSMQSAFPGEVIYQIYPATFRDSNGDGVGDLKGIIEKLPYVAALGVDAIWISPFFLTPEGPDGDGGYAVSDYRKVDPKFGSNDDFKTLLDLIHDKGMKLYTDFVLSHTSFQHEWFQKSAARDPDYADFYLWHDGKIDAKGERIPPNNWISIFGGPAWTWHKGRGQWYFHNFLSSQPAVNYHNIATQDALLAEMQFWFDQGVDGFRLDALPHAVYDQSLQDIAPLPHAESIPVDKRIWYDYDQSPVMDMDTLVTFIRKLRGLCNDYAPQKILLGEVLSGRKPGQDAMDLATLCTDTETLCQMSYTDALLGINHFPQAGELAKIAARMESALPNGGNCNCISNHDLPRAASRLVNEISPERRQDALRQLYRIFFMLPGSFCLYNGEELALTQARIPEDIPYDCVIDPASFGAQTQGRDGERTPMPWSDKAQHAGFSEAAKPYLPVPKSHYDLAVTLQEKNKDSFLHFMRDLITWRKTQPALISSLTRILQNLPETVLGLSRQNEQQTLIGLFNLSPEPVTLSHPYVMGGKDISIGAYSHIFFGDVAP